MDSAIFNIWPNLSFEIIKYTIIFYAPFFILIVLLWFVVFFAIQILIYMHRYSNYKKIYLQIINEIKKEYLHKLQTLSTKDFIKQFINVLEMLVVKNKYKNLDEILLQIWFSKEEVAEIKLFIYKDMGDENIIESKIRNKINFQNLLKN